MKIPIGRENKGDGIEEATQEHSETSNEAIKQKDGNKGDGTEETADDELLPKHEKLMTWLAMSNGVNRLTVAVYTVGNAIILLYYMLPMAILYIEYFYVVDYLDDVE